MFPLGRIVISPGAMEALDKASVSVESYLERHLTCDWGDVDDSDKRSNELALQMDGGISSFYDLPTRAKIWVYTEPDRSVTTVMLPDEN